VLHDLLGIPAERVRFVHNQPTPYGRSTASELGEALGASAVMEVPFGGEEVTRAALNGLPLVMSRAGNPTSRAILGLARKLDQAGKELVALSR
jgi:Flp pilus assembly CpaE family ATPase